MLSDFLAFQIGLQELRSHLRSMNILDEILADILRIPGPLDVIFRPWGFRGNEVRSQPTR
jgi:hypothetical protein